MQSLTRVSVIISSYNHGAHLRRAIDSALAQSYPCEVIVVEDGSSDDSPAILSTFGERITAIYQQNNGQPSALNIGYARSSGDLVFFLDADDIMYPQAIATVVEQFDPVASTYMWYLDIIDESNNNLSGRIPVAVPAAGDLRPLVIRRGPANRICPPTSGMAWSRIFLDAAMPLPTTLKAWADSLLVDAAPLYGTVVLVPQRLGAYRIHAESNSRLVRRLNVENLERITLLMRTRFAYLSFHADVDTSIWALRNWRYQVMLTLLGKRAHGPKPSISAMGAAAWSADGSLVKRLVLVLLALTIRLLPYPASFMLADRVLHLEYI